MTVVSSTSWVRRAMLVLLVLVLLAPVFGWASGAVGYAEPLENAAEATGAADAASTTPGVFPGYTIPGLDTSLGTLVSAIAGTALTLVVAVGVGRLLEQ